MSIMCAMSRQREILAASKEVGMTGSEWSLINLNSEEAVSCGDSVQMCSMRMRRASWPCI